MIVIGSYYRSTGSGVKALILRKVSIACACILLSDDLDACRPHTEMPS